MSNGFEADMKPEEYFHLNNGRAIKNLFELVNALKSMDDDTFSHHVNFQRNDFENWVRGVFNDEDLAEFLSISKTREDMIKVLESHLYKSEDEEENEDDAEEENSKENIEIKKLPEEPEKEDIKEEKNVPDKLEPLHKAAHPKSKLDEILSKEKEIELREKKIEEIEERIEKELDELNSKRNPKFFSNEFVQGLVTGLLLFLVIGLIYIKFFT
jgi:hypothetical protein